VQILLREADADGKHSISVIYHVVEERRKKKLSVTGTEDTKVWDIPLRWSRGQIRCLDATQQRKIPSIFRSMATLHISALDSNNLCLWRQKASTGLIIVAPVTKGHGKESTH
jgi:hypothetical protein